MSSIDDQFKVMPNENDYSWYEVKTTSSNFKERTLDEENLKTFLLIGDGKEVFIYASGSTTDSDYKLFVNTDNEEYLSSIRGKFILEQIDPVSVPVMRVSQKSY